MKHIKTDIPRRGDYNHRPEGWKEIPVKEFMDHYYFHYCLKDSESRLIKYDESTTMSGLFSARLYDLEYPGCEDMGCAIVNDWKEGKMKFFRYGDDKRWTKFQGEFAAQFAGDNS